VPQLGNERESHRRSRGPATGIGPEGSRTSGVRGPAGAVIGREAADDVLFLMAYAENAPSKQKLTTVALGNAMWRKVKLCLG
jgi:hypothetical protein